MLQELMPDAFDHLAELGWYYYRCGAYAKTVHYYEQVFAQRDQNPDYYYHLAASAWALLENKEKALEYLLAAADHGWTHVEWTKEQEEFGILHAVGRSRPWLVLRTVKETGSVVAVAWLIGAAVCVVGLVCAQATVYAPRGLSLDFLNLVPWLFTLPIPLAVILVGTSTIARMLSRLDPVAIIERR